jgi:hypothetical protein
MSSTLVTILLWAAALSSGLMAGVYFAFSGFIMKAFGKIEPAQLVTPIITSCHPGNAHGREWAPDFGFGGRDQAVDPGD